jgi:adenine deaminase
MYLRLNDESFIPADKQLAYYNLSNLVRRNKFVRMAVKDNQIIGWIYASPGFNLHTKEKILQQSYFCSNQTGISAARVIKFLHQELIEEAKRLDIKLVMSTGSHFDEDNTFTKILERYGWERRGYIAIKKL